MNLFKKFILKAKRHKNDRQGIIIKTHPCRFLSPSLPQQSKFLQQSSRPFWQWSFNLLVCFFGRKQLTLDSGRGENNQGRILGRFKMHTPATIRHTWLMGHIIMNTTLTDRMFSHLHRIGDTFIGYDVAGGLTRQIGMRIRIVPTTHPPSSTSFDFKTGAYLVQAVEHSPKAHELISYS